MLDPRERGLVCEVTESCAHRGFLRICKTVPLQRGKKEEEEKKWRGKKGPLLHSFGCWHSQAEVAASGEVDLFDNHNGTLLNLTTAYVSQ